MKLPHKFNGGFGGFGTAGSEVDAAVFEIQWRKGQKTRSESFGGARMKLCGVRKSDLRSLLGHGFCDFPDAVTDVDDGSLAGCVEEFSTIGGDNPGAFATNGDRKRLLEIALEKRGRVSGHGAGNCSRGRKR